MLGHIFPVGGPPSPPPGFNTGSNELSPEENPSDNSDNGLDSDKGKSSDDNKGLSSVEADLGDSTLSDEGKSENESNKIDSSDNKSSTEESGDNGKLTSDEGEGSTQIGTNPEGTNQQGTNNPNGPDGLITDSLELEDQKNEEEAKLKIFITFKQINWFTLDSGTLSFNFFALITQSWNIFILYPFII